MSLFTLLVHNHLTNAEKNAQAPMSDATEKEKGVHGFMNQRQQRLPQGLTNFN